MRKLTALLLAALCCLGFAACNKVTRQEDLHFTQGEAVQTQPDGGKEEETMGEPVQQDIELVGPWHLDGEKNDLAAFADSLELFPGYGEWGASMEIRSNGQMSWYIGAEGWHGTYTLADGVVHAQLVSDLEQSTKNWDFRITSEHGTAGLEMDYQDMTIYWTYADQEDTANGTGDV